MLWSEVGLVCVICTPCLERQQFLCSLINSRGIMNEKIEMIFCEAVRYRYQRNVLHKSCMYIWVCECSRPLKFTIYRYTVLKTIVKLHDPSYYSGLVFSGFFLFLGLQIMLVGKKWQRSKPMDWKQEINLIQITKAGFFHNFFL